MNRHKFVFAWGRKMFFGLCWPIMTILAMIYLKSFILPETLTGWIYYGLTSFGFFGLLTCFGYFALYCPVVWLFPSYYICRIWSLVVICFLNLFIFLDGFVFSQYRFYFNKFAANVLMNKGTEALLGSNVMTVIMIILAVGAVLYWIQGNRIWQTMQRRFSNPVKYWYVVLIAVSLIASQVILYTSQSKELELRRVSMLFPQDTPYSIKNLLQGKVKDLGHLSVISAGSHINYPAQELRCNGRNNRNIFMFVVEGLNQQDVSEFKTPTIYHAFDHAVGYKSHYSGGPDAANGLFSLLYSLPSTYMFSTINEGKSSQFFTELHKRKYEVSFHSNQQDGSKIEPIIKANFAPEEIDHTANYSDYWRNTLPKVAEDDLRTPVFSLSYFPLTAADRDNSLTSADQQINQAIRDILSRDYLKDSIIIITGDHGDTTNNSQLNFESSFRVPMMIITPNRKVAVNDHMTSHYDVLPTIMKDYWDCKNPLTNASGKFLSDVPKKKWHIVSQGSRFAVIDFKRGNISSLDEGGGYKLVDFYGQKRSLSEGRQTLMLDALEDLNQFYRRR